MTQLFGIPLDTLTRILVIVTLVIVVAVALLALTNVLFFKIGVRNIPRRRTQMFLIVFALMLSTTLLSGVLATGDVITAAVQSVAVYNLGSVDEIVERWDSSYGFFNEQVYYAIQQHAKSSQDIKAVGAALVEYNLLLADQTSRQVRSNVTGLGIIPGSEQGFGGMQNNSGKGHLSIAMLKPNQVYLNNTAALLLNAHAGDSLYLYSNRWIGRRYALQIRAIVADGGLAGQMPYMLTGVSTFRTIEGNKDDITQVYIANRGTNGVSSADLSDQVADELQQWLPPGIHVDQVKERGIHYAQQAQDIFTRIFTLFCLFALAIGLLLIFLIFILLAAERRVEMGMARAIGVKRRHLILTFLFEGTLYDLLASFVGLFVGIGVGALIISILGPLLARINFPLQLTFQPRSLIIAYCLGVIFTFCSVAISSWLVSRMTIVEAIRNLPESGHGHHELRIFIEMGKHLLSLIEQVPRHLIAGHVAEPFQTRQRGEEAGQGQVEAGQGQVEAGQGQALPLLYAQQAGRFEYSKVDPRRHPVNGRSGLRLVLHRLRRAVLVHVPDAIIGLIRSVTLAGILPLVAGYWLFHYGLSQYEIVPFSLGISLIVVGASLLLQTLVNFFLVNPTHRKRVQKIFAALAGLTILAYWALPFDALASLGLPRFQGGIEVFFIAGSMMVLGAAWAIVANAELLVNPLVRLCSWLPRLRVMTKLASAYPLHHRFRTGLSVVMFSLVIFAMTVMAVITNAMQNNYTDINFQTGGYDIQAVAYFKPLPDIRAALLSHGINPDNFTSIGVRTATNVGVIQTNAQDSAWHLYPAQIVSGGFLQGYGLHLTARAQGFSNDSSVWQALQSHSNYALIDSSALPLRPGSYVGVYDPNAPNANDAGSPSYPPGYDPYYTFSMNGVYQGDSSFPATPVWVSDAATTSAMKLTIIGVVDNSDSSHFGLYISSAAYAQSHIASTPSTPNAVTYYFKVAPGQDKRALSLALGSAFLDYGLETTVLEDAILIQRGPRILLSNVLLGIVGLTLLLGVAALAITGTRAVLERRQQIGMLRALGCKRRLLQAAFLSESFLVGLLGSLLGVVLGLILSHNIFAVDFFEQFNTGLTFTIPWEELGGIVCIALLASLLAALLPAWQAGRVPPIEALR